MTFSTKCSQRLNSLTANNQAIKDTIRGQYIFELRREFLYQTMMCSVCRQLKMLIHNSFATAVPLSLSIRHPQSPFQVCTGSGTCMFHPVQVVACMFLPSSVFRNTILKLTAYMHARRDSTGRGTGAHGFKIIMLTTLNLLFYSSTLISPCPIFCPPNPPKLEQTEVTLSPHQDSPVVVTFFPFSTSFSVSALDIHDKLHSKKYKVCALDRSTLWLQ